MTNIIKLKNSGTASATPSYLEYGELALNYNDEKIFYKNSLNQIVEFDLSGQTSIGSVEGTVYSVNIGNGIDTEFTIGHNLGTRDISVSIIEASAPYGLVLTSWEATTEDSITVYFESAPALNSIRVSVYVAVAGIIPPSIEGTVFNQTIGNDTDSEFILNHNFNSRDVHVSVREAVFPYSFLSVGWEATDLNYITLYFDSPPSLNSVRASVYIAVAGLEVGPQGPEGPQGPPGEAGTLGEAVLNDLSDVNVATPSFGDFLRYNGSFWDNSTITLGALTNGDYIESLVAGTGITLTNNSGAGSTPTISIGQAVATNSDVSFNSVTAGGVEVGLFSSTITTTSGNLTIAPASLIVNIGNDLVATGTISGSSVITNSIVFEGATADANETTLQVLDPTADRTISLPDATGTVSLAEIIIAQQTASYTLVLSDKDKMVEMNVGSANNLTVPPDSTANFAIGSQITILQTGTGQTTIVAGSGVTVNATPGLKLRARWSSVTLIKRAANTWVALGDLQA